MYKINTSTRTSEIEIMDDFELKGSELKKTLKDLDRVNYLLGGNQITHRGLKELLKNVSKDRTIRIADIGCGSGDMLRRIADFGREENYSFELIGIDANRHAVKIAEEISASYPEINFLNLNIFSEEFNKMKFDIILCTLTLHHFSDKEIKHLIEQLYRQSELGIVINDLHRTKWAYFLFKLFCAGFIRNEIAKQDGLTSILRGFTKHEMKEFSSKIQAEHTIKWKWAFRYLWVINKGFKKI